MSEKLKRIEFKHSESLTAEEVGRIAGFLATTGACYREAERTRLYDEVVEKGVSNRYARHEAAGRRLLDNVDEVTAYQEFSAQVRWLDEGIGKDYYELMGKISRRHGRFSMTSVVAGFLGVKPVMLEQHWGTEDLDDSGRDETEFQYLIVDPEILANPPLAEEVKEHLDFVAEMEGVSDKEIPTIRTFGTLDEEQLREILPDPIGSSTG